MDFDIIFTFIISLDFELMMPDGDGACAHDILLFESSGRSLVSPMMNPLVSGDATTLAHSVAGVFLNTPGHVAI